MRGHTKFLGGFENIEGARLSGGLLQRGVLWDIIAKMCCDSHDCMKTRVFIIIWI